MFKSSAYLSNSKLIFWDNSPSIQSVDFDGISFLQQVEYIHTPENMSLSKIYNKVIQNNEGYDYLIILDQDSSFASDYFEKLNSGIEKHSDVNLFLPLVKSEQTIVSPGDYKIFKGSYWEKEQYGVISAKNILAINSGMVINFNYLKNTYKGYDERLNFYGTDTFFMNKYSKDNNFLFVIDYVFKHDSALLDEGEDCVKKIKRLKDLFFSWRIINENKKINLILINIYILIKIFKFVVKYKNLNFFELLKTDTYAKKIY